MLAQNFKTADDLDISEVELTSLIKVLGMLEREELIHGEFCLAAMPRQANEFNMGSTLDNHCGTVGCIAGWAHHISGGEAFPEIVKGQIEDWGLRANKQLLLIFGIGRNIGALANIKPAQAATALRSYLTIGEAHWDLAVA